ncbi:hypothetical protein QOZ80_6BG0469090 [Eleusine coracana subsp. coracana]|nr:hypothetical protein QOZ80_6BG0469090 [Eleusine coracana subsp. coracana]
MLPADCPFSKCLCRWRSLCFPRIPLVDVSPADAIDSPAWSVVMGVTSMSDGDRLLRLHRFRVAHSGLIFGRSCDSLEILGDDYYKATNISSNILVATATPSPDGRSLSLCLFSFEFDYTDVNKIGPPLPLQLDMDLVEDAGNSGRGVTVSCSRLPDLPTKVGLMPTCPISAAGELWAPYLTGFHGPSQFVMQRLLQEYQPRGVYVKEDDTIYFLYGGIVYAYRLCMAEGKYSMAVPTIVDRVCPFPKEGRGFLAHLSGRVMCSVWIGLKISCNCDAKHVLITTFRVKGARDDSEFFVPKGIEVLHCSSRMLNMSPSKSLGSYLEFSFLQEFNLDNATSSVKKKKGRTRATVLLDAAASSNVVESSKMLTCCRMLLSAFPAHQ